ncbi:MAG TPA: radical SAM/SPASM domain-containing protein [Persephonella sp.]|uniref:Heme d1 biosynthesis protein NirJ n=1 Tax=Persephonella marina (strain DSM 14350 / EX-H1) TaxID=123214 RepID=C0QTT6_PERMH|nr:MULTISPECIES: radical SAM protein [Persephonella]ACO04129.1 heme d1 biosynthesis protein NirJ [Persephonella marina EX-H1]HCB70281.1 radical SAM/SPASM domain-containing protein [Persephonella sp.]
MLRITEYIRKSLDGKKIRPFNGVILIWNLTNACNLFCQHCYSAANLSRAGEPSIDEIRSQIPYLKEAGVKVLILSGGEPLIREDIFDIANLFKENGFNVTLSTNGLLIDEKNIESIKECFSYVGISIDGDQKTHDAFRGMEGAFERSVEALRLVRDSGIKTGIRFTITSQTYRSIPFIFDLALNERIPKIYFSHLVYSGRGRNLNQAEKEDYRKVVDYIIERSFEFVDKGVGIDVVTGNNEADAVVLYEKFKERYPEKAEILYENLKIWGGNQAGVRIADIDYRGFVKPDTYFPLKLGNIKEKNFYEIWNSNGILSKLRQHPRPVEGRCKYCRYLEICNGNSRSRAYAVYGNYFAEDPECYI